MAKYIVPSKAASGAQTFNDNLVGNQITNGTSQLTNTNFDIDRVIPEKDNKTFKTGSFSEFLTLESLKKETNDVSNDMDLSLDKNDKIKFKSAKKDAGVSLFGSLSSRIFVSITNIIKKFPSGFLIDKDNFISSTEFTANDILYNNVDNTTEFLFELSRIYNPFDINFSKPNTNVIIESENSLRNFYSAYKNYVLEINNKTYQIIEYSEPDEFNNIKIKTIGEPFSGVTEYGDSILIRPKNGIIEEFFNNLDILETQLLNRESNPIYTSTFTIPKDTDNGNNTILTSVSYSWPISKDGWNIQISGLNYKNFVTNLSDVANQIDNYKSNLFLRFLSSPQLFEFDSQDKKIESIFQLYGQSFDNVKKYIDNIAYMRNISYDGINNVPDMLLKNLSETLGLSTINLFDEKKFDEFVYTRLDKQYDGESIGKNLIESEYEFYRRMLVNLAHIYKSKGTKTSIEFFLKFLGAPEPLIKINEYVYNVNELPKSKNLENDIFDVIQGSKTFVELNFNISTYSYEKSIVSGFTTFNRSGYPVNENTLEPRRAINLNDNIYFQKGSGWYDITLDHRSSDILDLENSILTGRTKTLKTKMKPYTYGEDYFDIYRTLPGLDTGYELELKIDNKKTQIVNEKSNYVLNKKNISIHLSPSRAIDYDIWNKSRSLIFTSNTLIPQTGKTFAEFLNTTIHTLIRNSNVIKYKKNYIKLIDVYNAYCNDIGFNHYNYIDVNEFITKISPYWSDLISQFIPATTLWTGGNLIENSVFGRSKYKYNQPCQPLEFVENLYPDFYTAINEDLETLLGQEENFRGLINITGVTYYPIIEIDGVKYKNDNYSVIVSGTTSTSNTAALLSTQFEQSGCTSLNTNDNLPLICDYKTYVNPDVDKIKELWLVALFGLIDEIVNKTKIRTGVGYYQYQPYTAVTSGQTIPIEYVPMISYSIFKDNSGIDKIRFTSIKYDIKECSVKKYFDYTFDAIYSPVNPTCYDTLDFSTYCDVYESGTENCLFNSDVYFNLSNVVGIQNNSSSILIYNEDNLNGNYPLNIPSGRTIQHISGCTFKIENVNEYDNINFNILSAGNCELNVNIEGLQMKSKYDPYNTPKSHYETITITSKNDTDVVIDQFTGLTWCDNYSGYTLYPKFNLLKTYNYGFKNDSILYVINPLSNVTDDIDNEIFNYTSFENYIEDGDITEKEVSLIESGDIILCLTKKDCTSLSNHDIRNALNTNFTFMFEYSYNVVTDKKLLGTLKTSMVTGRTKNNVLKTIEILPTTELLVYTNKIITNGSIIPSKYHFEYRNPEDLIINKITNTEPCCFHNNKEISQSDFLIDVDGNLIEVIDVDLNYCDFNIYFNINFNNNLQYINTINGINDKFILRHKYENHDDEINNFKIEQYYTSINCDDVPTIGSLERPHYNGNCEITPVVNCSPIV